MITVLFDFEPFWELLVKRFQERKVDHLHFQHWKTGPTTDSYSGPTTPSTMVFMYLQLHLIGVETLNAPLIVGPDVKTFHLSRGFQGGFP